jgi:hypothetical protein
MPAGQEQLFILALYGTRSFSTTAGELVAEQIPGYTPYADKNGLWVRAWPSPDRSLLEQDWKPHMDGSVTLQQALTKLMSDLASTA